MLTQIFYVTQISRISQIFYVTQISRISQIFYVTQISRISRISTPPVAILFIPAAKSVKSVRSV